MTPLDSDDYFWNLEITPQQIEEWRQNHTDPVFGVPIVDADTLRGYYAVEAGLNWPLTDLWHYNVQLPGFEAPPAIVRVYVGITGPDAAMRDFFLLLVHRCARFTEEAINDIAESYPDAPDDLHRSIYPDEIRLSETPERTVEWTVTIRCGYDTHIQDLAYHLRGVGETITEKYYSM